MVKKAGKKIKADKTSKKTSKTKSITKATKKRMTKAELEAALIDNFMNLQKVLTNLAIKFNELSNQISKLLQVFEISAKSFAEKNKSGESFIEKIDTLLDQNKTIARALTLIEEKRRERGYDYDPSSEQSPPEKPRPSPMY